MRILFDQGTPAPLRHLLHGHEIVTAGERGWSTLGDGELLAAAEAQGFEVFVTTDMNLRHQQNLARRIIAIVVLGTTSWPRIRQAVGSIAATVDAAAPATIAEIAVA